MNISNEGGSIVPFTSPWPSRNEPEAHANPQDPDWLDYCRAREFAERAAAKDACSMEARRAHQEMAQAYADAVRKSTIE